MLALRVKQPWCLLHLRVFGHCCQRQNLLKGSHGISSWHRWGPKCPPGAFLGSQAANYQTGFPEVAAPKICLLVDADAHGIEVIRQGISCLEKEGYEVHTLLFAPPGRESNKKWKRLISEPYITFCPVPRASTYLNQPNDDAIISIMMKPCSMVPAASLALLTSDAGFTGPALDVQAGGRSVIMLIPGGRVAVVREYEAAGLQVIKLESNDAVPKVRAILHEDGSGSVHMAEAYDPSTHPDINETVKIFLKDSGITMDDGYLIQKCAKYWFLNCSGSIAVYPPQLATLAVHDTICTAKIQPTKTDFAHLAYFLPISGFVASRHQTFGSSLARQVWEAGGPFMKQDSPTLVAEVLEQLGYDVGMNADLREPIFCFINKAANKKLLRQIGMLPVPGESRADVMGKLQAAFLSNLSSGMWQRNKPQTATKFGGMQQIMQILKGAGLLPLNDAVEVSRDEVFAAMKVYGQKEGLPLMQTFDALALRIRHHNNMNPALRKLIEID